MITDAICFSHSPLLDSVRADPLAELSFGRALAQASAFLDEAQPNLIVVLFPDHMNGFFHGSIPHYCVGTSANSLGDWGTAPGQIEVAAEPARSLAGHLHSRFIQIEVRNSMLVDHGCVQPLELLGAAAPIIPLFVNCAAEPRATFAECEILGKAVGEWAAGRPERILVIGSGGLSHDPPLPDRTALPDYEAGRDGPRQISHAMRIARQRRVLEAAWECAAGTLGAVRPLAPAWDEGVIAALAEGNTGLGNDWSDEDITAVAGSGAQEVRCWIAAMAALAFSGTYVVRQRFYVAVPEWLTGMGILTASRRTADSAGGDTTN